MEKKANEKNKVFIACDSKNIKKIKEIIKITQNKKITFGYKFGLEFLNSQGRSFIKNLKIKLHLEIINLLIYLIPVHQLLELLVI